jgi:hypothetical protein
MPDRIKRCWRPLLVMLLLVAGPVGCLLVSGQIVVVVKIAEVVATTEQEIDSVEVDLTQNDDYNEHKDELKSVEEVLFQMTVRNNTSSPLRARIYASAEGNLQSIPEIVGQGFLVLETPELQPLEERFIPFDDSAGYLHNIDALKDLALKGHFFLYMISEATPFDLTMEDVVIVVTLTFEV